MFYCLALSIATSALGSIGIRHWFTATFNRAVVLYAKETSNCMAGHKFDVSKWVV